MLMDDMITTGHARALLGIEDAEEQVHLAHKIFDEKMSVREVEKFVQKMQGKKKEKKVVENNFVYQEIENKMKEVLGTKVMIRHQKNNKGKIEIEYYSNEDLDRILEMIESIQN